MKKSIVLFASISGALAVILGAMAAHALKEKLTTEHIQVFETAARYQMYHSIVLLLIGFVFDKINHKFFQTAAYCFMAGVVLFSGSLYFLSTTEITHFSNLRWLGPVTPLGGLLFILGWLLTGIAAYKSKT
jgi:uncharacterized membrane protein YgdD (TMEM256/DUF423 family)